MRDEPWPNCVACGEKMVPMAAQEQPEILRLWCATHTYSRATVMRNFGERAKKFVQELNQATEGKP